MDDKREELDQLIKQRALIEEKIQNLRNRCWRSGCARLLRDPFASGRKDIYTLQIQRVAFDSKKPRWTTLGRDTNINGLAIRIPEFIKDLQGLYELLQKEE